MPTIVSKYYSIKDIACQCGCGFADLHPLVVHDLDSCCDMLGRKLHLTSVCRCPEHNESPGVGGEPNSYHTRTPYRVFTYAADIWVGDLTFPERHDLLTYVFTRFNGIGLYLSKGRPRGKLFIHVDKRPWALRTIWSR